MPKERDRSHQASDQEPRSHRSSSHRHRSHKHDEGKRSHRHRHTPYHREKEPRSSTHIYFNGSDNVPVGSLHTDHVALASSLSSLMEQNGGMAQMLGSCYEMLERLRGNQLVYPSTSRQSATKSSSTDGRRGVNLSNLANVPRSPKSVAKKPEPSFSGILETYKTASLVPAQKTKAQLHQSLNSHTEAKLDSIDISLLCPLTRSRMGTPMRGRNCTHIPCFDGEAYLQLMWEKHVEKWKCPICKCLAPLSELVVDEYIMEILETVPEDVKSVEFTSDRCWQIKGGDSSLMSINKSSDDSGQRNIAVIDLTFDTPKKCDQKKFSNVSSNSYKDGPPVIDLTLSP